MHFHLGHSPPINRIELVLFVNKTDAKDAYLDNMNMQTVFQKFSNNVPNNDHACSLNKLGGLYQETSKKLKAFVILIYSGNCYTHFYYLSRYKLCHNVTSILTEGGKELKN